ADVHYVGALLNHGETARDGCVGLPVSPKIVERVRRDIQDAHNADSIQVEGSTGEINLQSRRSRDLFARGRDIPRCRAYSCARGTARPAADRVRPACAPPR